MKKFVNCFWCLTQILLGSNICVLTSCNKNIDLDKIHVTNFVQLKTAIEEKARRGLYESKEIVLDQDIVCSEPIYVMNDTTITCNSSHSITRSSAYLDDIFVIGEDENGNNPILSGEKAKLTLKTNDINVTLTIDGNKDNITGSISGSAIFVSNHSEVNINNNIVIQNCRKDVNSRTLTKRLSKPTNAGGAAVIVTSGTFNMYGGTINNCICPAEDESADKAYMGGAIYNESGFNMYGGTISNCSAARGGALYEYSYCNLVSGSIEKCSATKYGGAIYLPNSQYVNLVLGSAGQSMPKIIFKQNSCVASGGAIFGGHQSVIYSMGNCIFEKNTATNNGGAINSAGSILLDNTEFNGNTATNGTTAKGGAIYAYTNSGTLAIRNTELNNCVFDSNTACNGGAVTFDSNSSEYPGAIGLIKNTTFKSNIASGNGGALYCAKKSNVSISSSTFNQNSATGNGGAIYNTNSTISLLKDTTTNLISLNSSQAKGGAIAVHSGGTVNIAQANLDQNTSKSNGGALYLYGGNCTISAENKDDVTFTNNSSTNGGAVYVEATDSNEAVLNATYLNASNNIVSENGGGVYIYTNAGVNINNLLLTKNKATGAASYGGGLYASEVSNTIIDYVEANENSSYMGGFAYITTANTSIIIKSGSALNNTTSAADPSGRTLWCNAESSVVKIKGKVSKQYFNFDGDISGVTGFEVQDYEE